jgi:type III secretory pathway component EscS
MWFGLLIAFIQAITSLPDQLAVQAADQELKRFTYQDQ